METVTIDQFCAREQIVPTLIKIDVEGWELEALRGARETIARGGDGLALFVEMHPTAWRERGLPADAVRAELDRAGAARRAAARRGGPVGAGRRVPAPGACAMSPRPRRHASRRPAFPTDRGGGWSAAVVLTLLIARHRDPARAVRRPPISPSAPCSRTLVLLLLAAVPAVAMAWAWKRLSRRGRRVAPHPHRAC